MTNTNTTNYWVWITALDENNQSFEFLDSISANNRYQAEAKALDQYRWAQSARAV